VGGGGGGLIGQWSSRRQQQREGSIRSKQQHQQGHLQCPMCNFRARYPSSLTRHMTTHTGEKPYACTYCDYSATQKEHLERHIRRHTGERPYVCPYCPYTAIQRISLQGHLRTHNQQEQEHVISVESPDAKYTDWEQLPVHRHSESLIPCSQTTCEKNFEGTD
ncbi:unnamed protein product, partial [Meganyctiphanes norvegica]